jgi:hypothetical protein
VDVRTECPAAISYAFGVAAGQKFSLRGVPFVCTAR